jgi:hypothetical protein
MGRRNYEGSKKQHIIKLLNMGYSDTKIVDLYEYDYGYIKYVRRRHNEEIKPAFYFQSTGNTAAKLNGKLETYYTNELDYGTIKPEYKIEEVETEYDISDKPPTMFGACRTIGNA